MDMCVLPDHDLVAIATNKGVSTLLLSDGTFVTSTIFDQDDVSGICVSADGHKVLVCKMDTGQVVQLDAISLAREFHIEADAPAKVDCNNDLILVLHMPDHDSSLSRVSGLAWGTGAPLFTFSCEAVERIKLVPGHAMFAAQRHYCNPCVVTYSFDGRILEKEEDEEEEGKGYPYNVLSYDMVNGAPHTMCMMLETKKDTPDPIRITYDWNQDLAATGGSLSVVHIPSRRRLWEM